MRYEVFGQKTGLRVSTLVLGGGMFGTANGYGARSDDVQAILRTYVDAGGNFVDTSDAYQQGQSETAIGEFVAGSRDDYVIASKYSRTAARAPAIAAAGAHRKAMVGVF